LRVLHSIVELQNLMIIVKVWCLVAKSSEDFARGFTYAKSFEIRCLNDDAGISLFIQRVKNTLLNEEK
jgi:hypothetical protein